MIRRFSTCGVCLLGFVATSLVGCGDGEPTRAMSASLPGGNAGSGGDEAGGSNASGGSGPSSGLGGATTGGSNSSGGASNGGASGGASNGGASNGGASPGTTVVVPVPCEAAFVSPTNGAVLRDEDDQSGTYCQSDFTYDVVVATNAKSGTLAQLYLDGGALGDPVAVSGAIAKFTGVRLGNASNAKRIEVRLDEGTINACTTSEISVTIDCLGIPSCALSVPTFDPTKRAALNGVSITQSGDRVSPDGAPYQTQFKVNTNVEDGQPVSLTIDNGAPAYAVAVGGLANFGAVTVQPDGDHVVRATCQAASKASGQSAPLAIDVDSTPPAPPTLTKWTGFTSPITADPTDAVSSALGDENHFGPNDDANPAVDGLQMRLCGTAADADATDLAIAANRANFCVSLGTDAPVCAPVNAANANRACVDFTCPGDGKFDLAFSLKDAAQNVTTVKRVDLTCAAENPQVVFAKPLAGPTPSDSRVLAFSNSSAAQRDKNPNLPGAQFDVVACTNAPVDPIDGVKSQATLRVGRQGAGLSLVGSVDIVPDTIDDYCPTGGPQNIAIFRDVNLPESVENLRYELTTATEIEVTVDAPNGGGLTKVADVWVDTTLPSVSVSAPNGICGSYISSATDVVLQPNVLPANSALKLTTPVTTVVTVGDGNLATLDEVSYTCALPVNSPECTVGSAVAPVSPFATLKVGTNTISATATEPSGNSASLTPCVVTVGPGANAPPKLTWDRPKIGEGLAASTTIASGSLPDLDAGTGGWQGELRVCSDLRNAAANAVTVSFAIAGSPVGSPMSIDPTTGCASLNPATVPEGASVQLTATTSGGDALPASLSINVPVDLNPPSAASDIAAVVSERYRRESRFTLSWNAPLDGANGAPTDYDIKYSKELITQANFDSATTVLNALVPSANQGKDSIDIGNLVIGQDYYFAVRASDAVGNKGPVLATAAPVRATYLIKTLGAQPVASAVNFGYHVDGSSDLNGDGYADLVVSEAYGVNAYVYFGGPNGFITSTAEPVVPSLRFTGNQTQFGSPLAGVGDINGDSIADLAISAYREGDGVVYVYYGKRNWSDTELTTADADLTIAAGSSYAASWFGYSVARLGDLNGDAVDDFAIGVPQYRADQGQVVIVWGSKTRAAGTRISVGTGVSTEFVKLDGDASIAGKFGREIVGLGRFDGSSEHPTMIVAAYSANVGGLTAAGRLYAYRGAAGKVAPILSGTTDGTAANQQLGFYSLQHMGSFGPNSQPTVGVPMPGTTPAGRGRLFSGNQLGSPFSVSQYVDSGATSGSSGIFGRFMIGGGVRGTGTSLAWYVSESDRRFGVRPDLVISKRLSALDARIQIFDGYRLPSAFTGATTSLTDANADITITMPSGFTDFGRYTTPSPDLTGDGFPDFAVGDISWAAVVAGRVHVCY